jgi:hypothetical protein
MLQDRAATLALGTAHHLASTTYDIARRRMKKTQDP